MFQNFNIPVDCINSVDSLLIVLSYDYTIIDLNFSAELFFDTKKNSVINKNLAFLHPYFDQKNSHYWGKNRQSLLDTPNFYSFTSEINREKILWFLIPSNGADDKKQFLLIGSVLHCDKYSLKKNTAGQDKSLHEKISVFSQTYTGQIVNEKKIHLNI